MRKLLALLLLCAFSAPAGAEAGYASRDLELRAEPASGAKAVGSLPKGAKLEILREEKAWAQVKSGELTGWTFLFYVMKGEPPPEVGAGRRLSELWSLGTERRAETSATIGIRGLDEEELRAAQFNAEELKRLESLLLQKSDGEALARQGKLAPRAVGYLPAPAQGAAPAQQ